MAEVKEKVMNMVRKELDKDPDVENSALYEKAKKIDSSIGDLSLRQFHARYPLQVKRQKAQKTGRSSRSRRKKAGSRRSKKKGQVNRDTIRGTLLRFAKDVSAAEGKAEMIDLLANVDRYVDDVVEAMEDGGR